MKSSGRTRGIETWPLPHVRFVAEQVGGLEDELKSATVQRWLEGGNGRDLRAYLAQVAYPGDKETSIALCIASDGHGDKQLIEEAAAVFRGMFRQNQHLDIFFLNQRQEGRLRRVCCPFFSPARFVIPDFWMVTSDGYLLDEARACYKERRLTGDHSDGYMLCEIDPPFIGQRYGLGGSDINRVVMASRHQGSTLFPIDEWPAYVHVARLTVDLAEGEFSLSRDDCRSMIWAEVYKNQRGPLRGRRRRWES